MDIKVEIEHINLICHGCLTTDRKVRHILGEFRTMFYFLRNDDKAELQRCELQLCWECIGFLKKLQMFQAKIRKAECILVTTLQNYNEDGYTNSQCLSSLKYTNINTYTYECNEEEKMLLEVATNDNNELKYEKDRIEIEVTDIKIERNDNIEEEYNNSNNKECNVYIKKQHNYSNNNDSDYYNTELKIEKEANIENYKEENNKKKYQNLAMVAKTSNVNDSDYNDTVLQIEKEDNIEKSSIVKEKIDNKKYQNVAMVAKNSNVNDSGYNDTELQIEKEANIEKSSIVKENIDKKKYQNVAMVVKTSNVNDSDYNDTELKIDKEANIEKSSIVKEKIDKKKYQNLAMVAKNSKVNDSDYKDTELKRGKEEKIHKSTGGKKKNTANKNKYYAKLALVTKRKDIGKKNYCQYIKSVCLSHKEYEYMLIRDGKHYGKKNQINFKCDKCRLVYCSYLDLLRHISFRHNEQATFPYTCAACDTVITSSEHLDEHWTETHTKMLKCTLCTKVYRTMREAKKHVYREHTKNYDCKKCGLEFRLLTEFKKHYKNIHEKATCDYCNKSFTNKIFVSRHIRFEHIPEHCKLCDRNLKNLRSLRKHNTVTHPELTAGETRKELSYCVECNRQYSSVYKYKRHLLISPRHTPQKKIRVPCPECGKEFAKTPFMKNHYRLFHLKVTKYYCKECDKYFANGYGLRLHIKRIHEKIAPPKNKFCDICGRGFATNKILENHRRTHTGERPFMCKYCPAAFAQKFAMTTHQKTQHKNLDLPS